MKFRNNKLVIGDTTIKQRTIYEIEELISAREIILNSEEEVLDHASDDFEKARKEELKITFFSKFFVQAFLSM